MTPAAPVVVVEGLSHTYVTREGPLEVLRDVSLVMERGAYVSLMGSSGSGKSTLLAVLGGLERPQSGRVRVADTDLRALARDELALTFSGVPPATRHRRATDLLADVGLDARMTHRPHELSGGERQRVAIARAIANDPELILADEPTGNLDIDAAQSVAELLASLRDDRDCTLLVVTHNPSMATHADMHYALADGHLAPAPLEQAEQEGRSGHAVA
jgi:putative ABC transport system ATP-binding protein